MNGLGTLFYTVAYWFVQPFRWVFSDGGYTVSVGAIRLLLIITGFVLPVCFSFGGSKE